MLQSHTHNMRLNIECFQIVVCIIADGRKVTHPRVLDWYVTLFTSQLMTASTDRMCPSLAALGVYQKDVGKNKVDNKHVQAHVYEYTTQLSIDPDLKFKGLEKGIVPAQVIFCLKERSKCMPFLNWDGPTFAYPYSLDAKKLNSHRWLFNAFCPLLQPNVVVLLDVGTKPSPKSIYHLWKTFDLNSNVGGAVSCGLYRILVCYTH